MITINMPKARNISHDVRRAARAREFEPHDRVIAMQIPGTSAQDAETARQAIRERYAALQTRIDAAADAAALRAIVAEIQAP